MGEPALVTVRRESATTEAFTSQSGGYSLGSNLIEYGVDGLIHDHLDYGWQKESADGLEATRAHLGWAESILVIDFPNRLLLWDLHCLEIEAPRLVSHLIETTSPGWRAVWCPGDYDSVWRYLGGDETVHLFAPPGAAHHDLPDDYFGPFKMPEFGFGEATLFTANLLDGHSACWLSDKHIEYVPHATAAQLTGIAEMMTGDQLEMFAIWPHLSGSEDYDSWPSSGVHLDFLAKTAWGWDVWGLDWRERFPGLWPGWKFVKLGDCWEIQEGRTRGRVIRQPLREVMLEALGFRTVGSPMSSPGGDPYRSHTRRDALIRELLDRNPLLAPTAFLQDDGHICWNPKTLYLA